MLNRTDVRMVVTQAMEDASSPADLVTNLVNFFMDEMETMREDGYEDGFSDGQAERLETVNDETYQRGYNDGHNAFIQQIVDTLDFRGQEAMIAHIERSIGFPVTQGNACR